MNFHVHIHVSLYMYIRYLCNQATVIQLVECLHTSHHIYTDNFYSRPGIIYGTKKMRFGACGTARVDRKRMPKQFKNKRDMEKGDVRKVEI